jgi:hypothetical protein
MATLLTVISLGCCFGACDDPPASPTYSVTVKNSAADSHLDNVTIEFPNKSWKFHFGTVSNGGSAACGGVGIALPPSITLRWTDKGINSVRRVEVPTKVRRTFRPATSDLVLELDSKNIIKVVVVPKPERQD